MLDEATFESSCLWVEIMPGRYQWSGRLGRNGFRFEGPVLLLDGHMVNSKGIQGVWVIGPRPVEVPRRPLAGA